MDPTPPSLHCLQPICLHCLKTKIQQAIQKDKFECQSCKAESPKGSTKRVYTEHELKLESRAKELRDMEKERPVCGLHPPEIVTHYCWRCEAKVCTKCVEDSHTEHSRFSVQTLEETAERLDGDLAMSIYNRQYEMSKAIETLKGNWSQMKRDVGDACTSMAERPDSEIEAKLGVRREDLPTEKDWQDEVFAQVMDEWEEENRVLTELVKGQGVYEPRK